MCAGVRGAVRPHSSYSMESGSGGANSKLLTAIFHRFNMRDER